MDGPGLIYFTLEMIPGLIKDVTDRAGLSVNDINLYLMHQPTRLLIDRLREHLQVGEEKLPMVLEGCGNTVSSTIPIVIDELRKDERLRPGMQTLIIGFGVGLSWAGCAWTETWDGREAEMMTHQSELSEDIATATAAGDATTAPVRAGAASGLIRSIEPASYILREIVSEAEDILKHRPHKLLGG